MAGFDIAAFLDSQDRLARGHGLEHDDAERLADRTEQECAGPRQHQADLEMVQPGQEEDAIRDTEPDAKLLEIVPLWS